jgi:hypothetical protein
MIDILAIGFACLSIMLGLIASRLSKLISVMDKSATYAGAAYTFLGVAFAGGILAVWLLMFRNA